MGNAASSSSCASSSSTLPPKKYDVFISFRGEDTRSNFTSHLYDALRRKGIRTYIDYELPRGDEINPSLMQAIEDSTISVVVFSENYANSKWCLNELVKIMECKRDLKQVVIPVFYKVDPSHVRHQEGTFKDAFDKHERDSRHDHQILNNWRIALSEIANLSGWDSRTCSNDSEFIGDFVMDVLQKLKPFGCPALSRDLVGMNENCDNIKMLLKEAPKIGIWGMGGIGKTTMARAVFNELSSEFEGCCFLENVREESKIHGLSYLAKKLLSELLKVENLSGNIPHQLVEPSAFAMRRLSYKKVFIVLDDVTCGKQLEYLAKHCHGLGHGSKVIITSRDWHLLIGNVDVIHEAKALTYDKSLQLFNLKTFKKDYMKIGYEELAKKAVDYAKGIPLALKVLGSFLHSRTIEEWKDALARLEKTPNHDIHEVLKLSFDGLRDDEKEMFLDIAFFFKGQAKNDVIRLLEANGFHGRIGLRMLAEKALISITYGIVQIHDLIQEMGWEIVRQENVKEPGKRSRLRDSKEIYSVLKNNTGSDAIEGIMWDFSQMKDISLDANIFKRMTKLRFLKFYGRSNLNLSLPFGLEWPSNNTLTYFGWHSYPLNSLPSTFCPENVVELDMPNSQLKKLWDGVQNFVNLKSIYLEGSRQLIELPDFAKAQNLEEVNLKRCSSLRYVHPSILSLQKLVSLYLVECIKLEELKSETHLKSLSNFCVDQCISLTEFSLSSGKIEYLILDSGSIEILGSAIGRLCKLRKLWINGSRLKKVPVNELCCLRSLVELSLTNCELVIVKQELHILFEALKSLQKLSLEGCCNITELPHNIKNLSRLKRIELTYCRGLQSIPELPPSTQYVDATNCLNLNECSLSRIEDFSYFCLKRAAYINVRHAVGFCYPGSRVPKWFKYTNQTKEASCTVTIDLSSGFTNLLSFVLCCVVPQSSLNQNSQRCYLRCQSYFEDGAKFTGSSYGYWHDNIGDLNSDHVFIWFDNEYSVDRLESYLIREHHKGNSDSLKLSFLFYLDDIDFPGRDIVELNQACVVFPIYASEYHNFLHERGLKISKSGSVHELSRDGVMEYALFSLNSTNIASYPQHVIPEWFTYQSSTTYRYGISVSLSPDVDCLLGFLFCFFIPQFSSEVKKNYKSNCRCFLEDFDIFANGPEGWHYSMKQLSSDNVFIWHDPLFCESIIQKLRSQRCTIEEGTSTRGMLTFEYKFGEECLIKECGVRPIYALEYSDFLQQMDEGRKTKRFLERDDEEQPLAPTKKLKESSNIDELQLLLSKLKMES